MFRDGFSEQLLLDRLLQAHVLRPLNGNPVAGVVVYHLGHRHEVAGKVAETEIVVCGIATDTKMHESFGTPKKVKSYHKQ